jgi:hypothetical protein
MTDIEEMETRGEPEDVTMTETENMTTLETGTEPETGDLAPNDKSDPAQ